MAIGGYTSTDWLTVNRQYGDEFNLTVSFWYKSAVAGDGNIVGLWEDSGSVYQFMIACAGGNTIVFATNQSGGSEYFVSSSQINTGSWNHLVLVLNYGTSGSLSGWINGTLDNTVTARVPLGPRIGFGFDIGNRVYGESPCSGKIAEVATWKRALSAGEISGLSKGISPKRYPAGLDCYLPLVRNPKEIKSGVSITVHGAPTVADHVRIYQ